MHPYGGPWSTAESTKLIHARTGSMQELNQRFVPKPHNVEYFTESFQTEDSEGWRRVGRAIVIILPNQHMSATRSTHTVPPRDGLEPFSFVRLEAFLMANAGAQLTRDGPPSSMLSRGHISIIASLIRNL